MLYVEEIVCNESLGDGLEELYRLVLRGPIAKEAQPGQFIHLKVSLHTDPLLRRPFSLFDINRQREEITVIYRIKGAGTQALAKVGPGDRLSALGPLGHGFSLPVRDELWLVGGGIGVFPLYPLATTAMAQGIKVRLYWGGESRKFLETAGLAWWQTLGLDLHLTTLDGSIGEQGLVTASLDRDLHTNKNLEALQLATCGPKGMMKQVTVLGTSLGIPVEVSLEERMGCAVGACLGCACQLRSQNGQIHSAKVCHDGPVFRGEEVVWDA